MRLALALTCLAGVASADPALDAFVARCVTPLESDRAPDSAGLPALPRAEARAMDVHATGNGWDLGDAWLLELKGGEGPHPLDGCAVYPEPGAATDTAALAAAFDAWADVAAGGDRYADIAVCEGAPADAMRLLVARFARPDGHGMQIIMATRGDGYQLTATETETGEDCTG